ncbi:MAG: type secretion system tube protein Hcp [Pedosphaera sp.]|nr:type secretion system tube protein Hcp [Pedosphaera sp.]
MFLRALAACVAVSLFPSAAHAQWSGCLRLDGVPGESQDTRHRNWIDVLSADSANIFNLPVIPGTTGTTGSQQPLSIGKKLDAASPVLALLCGKQSAIKTGTLDLTTNSAIGPVLRLELTNIFIGAVSQMGDSSYSDAISEQILLQAQVMAWYYTQFSTKSGLPNYVASRWDFSAATGLGGTNGPMTITTGIRMTNGVELRWNAVSGQSYRVFAVPRLGAPFTLVSFQTATNSGTMTFNLPATNNAMFYVVENLP